MGRQTSRILVTCGVVAGTLTFFGATYAVDPPHDTPKHDAPKRVSLTDKPATKAPITEKDAADDASPARSKNNEPSPAKTTDEKPEKSEKPAKSDDTPPTSAEALKMLREGNERWMKDKDTNPNTDPSRRTQAAENGQKPFATILTCADSRIPVERVFDRGVGELFVIRVAGNVVGPDASGTIEYGAEHLHVPVLVVMGHTKCGAVAAAAAGANPGGNVTQLVEKISPAVERTRQQQPELSEKDLAAAAVKENVWQSVFDLIRTSSVVRDMIQERKIQVVGAVYDVASGKVEWIGEHPWQSALVQAFNERTAKTQTAGATEHEKEH